MAVHVLEISVRSRVQAAAMLAAALARLHEEDPTFGYRGDGEPGAFVLLGTGETQLEIVIDRLRREHGLELQAGPPEVAFRVTVMRAVEYDYIHKRRTGTTGEFARLKLRVEPLPRGSGFMFEQAIRPGALPAELSRAISDIVNAAGPWGGFARYPVVDVKVTLVDAAYHDTDSTVPVFAMAAFTCFREAMTRAGPQLLEPVMRVEVATPDEYMGDVIGDLNARRGRVSGMEQRGDLRLIAAAVPFKEMLGYANRLRALTRGRASFTMAFDHYAALPPGGDDPSHPGGAIGQRIA